MNLSVLASHAHATITAAAARGVWSDWFSSRTGYVVRDLTPVVRSLSADGVPFLLTHRDAPPRHARALRREREPAPKLSLDEWRSQRAWIAQPKPGDYHRGGRITRLWSLFVEVPRGLVWELTSERFDARALNGSAPKSVAMRRPCDDHPLEDTPRLFAASERKLKTWFGDVADNPPPNPTAMIIRHHTCVPGILFSRATRMTRAQKVSVAESHSRRRRHAPAAAARDREAVTRAWAVPCHHTRERRVRRRRRAPGRRGGALRARRDKP